jgi:hypothetical protein
VAWRLCYGNLIVIEMANEASCTSWLRQYHGCAKPFCLLAKQRTAECCTRSAGRSIRARPAAPSLLKPYGPCAPHSRYTCCTTMRQHRTHTPQLSHLSLHGAAVHWLRCCQCTAAPQLQQMLLLLFDPPHPPLQQASSAHSRGLPWLRRCAGTHTCSPAPGAGARWPPPSHH